MKSRYRVIKKIGSGATSEVFEACLTGEDGFERRVALKRLRVDGALDSDTQTRFVEEARIAASLHHANIVSVFDYGVMDGVPTLVTELVEGFDLRTVRSLVDTIPEEIALHIASELAYALHAAHAASDVRGGRLEIVHRDVTPENVLLSFQGDIKLTDFGIARAIGRAADTAIGVLIGKPAYMAPEQSTATRVDARADIFSLACVLHFALRGTSPLDDPIVRERFYGGGALAVDPAIPKDVCAILERALRFKRSERYGTAGEMAQELGLLAHRRLNESARSCLARWIGSLEKRSPAPSALFDVPRSDEMFSGTQAPELVIRAITRATNVDVGLIAPAFARGELIDRYVVEELLGSGGMGAVYAAHDTELDRKVALKMLHGSASSPEQLGREARAMAKLNHPNVAAVYDVGRAGERMFITMELVRGQSLRRWLATPRPPQEIADVLLAAGRGLMAAHEAGIIHRDFKPENMMVGEDGRVRVLDFGIALARTAKEDELGSLAGTPAYMAPEQRARGQTDAQTDQWSFCATAYEALAGVPPFDVEDLAARTSAINEGRLALPAPDRDMPAWIRVIVTRGLRADPAERWPSMEALVDALMRGRHPKHRARTALSIAGVVVTGVAILILGFPPEPNPAAVVPPYGPTECGCPLSACTDHCVSVCNAPEYRLSAPVPGLNGDNQQEALLGVSADGASILYLTGPRCSLSRLMLARRRGATFEPADLTNQIDVHRLMLDEGCCTLSPDGRSVVMSLVDRNGFVRFHVSENDVLREVGGSEFSALDPIAAAGGVLRFPVLSADELTLYFRAWRNGPGVYSAEREDLRSPFRPAELLPWGAQRYGYVTGISSDGLSLFMESDYQTRVLVRATRDETFDSPTNNASPWLLAGWRAKPLEDCSRIVTTYTPGGCQAEDIVYLEASAGQKDR